MKKKKSKHLVIQPNEYEKCSITSYSCSFSLKTPNEDDPDNMITFYYGKESNLTAVFEVMLNGFVINLNTSKRLEACCCMLQMMDGREAKIPEFFTKCVRWFN